MDPVLSRLNSKVFICSAELRWQANAIMCLQEAAEAYLVSMLCLAEGGTGFLYFLENLER